MEETELEEGEAYDYHDDDDPNIDPDVDLSYLDEKVQVVLGHHQKDFEGGVSAENLGARFGGYGSFLPTYQRSPSIWSQPRTPQKVQNYGTPRSPNNLLMEGDFQNTAVAIGGASSAKHGSSTNAAPPTVSRAPLLETSSKRDSSLLSARGTAECTLNNGPYNKSNTATDHKTLKVRLKVGSDNMAEKTAAIFSDLGFHSSSPEDSPVESGGFSPESRESPDESPTSMLQIMTSSPVPDGIFLSPLPHSFVHLVEKEKFVLDNRTGLAFRDSEGSSSMLGDVSFSRTRDGKLCGEKKMKPMEHSRLIETKNGIVNDVGNGIKSGFLHKEIDIETPEGRALVADSLKLPILSNPNILIGETVKSTGRASEASGETKKIKVKDKFFSSDRVKEDSESMTSQDVNKIEKLKFKTSSGNKARDDRKEKGLGDKKEKNQGDQLEHVGKETQPLSRKDGWSKGHKSYDSYRTDFDDSKGRKELIDGTTDPPYNKVKVKAASLERGGDFPPSGIEQTFSEGRKKAKGSKTNGNSAVVSSQESSRIVTSAALKDQIKSSHSSSKTKLDSKLCKESGKTRDIYKDFFGDEEMDQAENSMNSPDTPFRDRPTEYKLEVIEKENRHADKPMDRSSSKEIHQFADNSRERLNGKKVENSMTSGYQQATPIVAPSTGNGLVSDTVCATVAPLVIKENWVACDKCGKWRLLPCDRNTADLPKKWLCSMLDWLPGMSRCSVSEEETTRALYALYGLPPPDSQNNVDSLPNGTAAGVTLPEGQHLDLRHQDQNVLGVPSGGKKKHGLKEMADVTSLTGPVHISNSINKNQQASLKSRSVNDVNHSPLDSNLANKGKSSDSAVEKHRHKRKDKHKLAQDGGVANQSKLKSKRDADQDRSRTSKKIKTEGLFSNEEEWASDHGGFMGSSGPTSMNCLSAKEAVTSMKKNGEYISSRESKFDMKDNILSSAKEPRERGHLSVDVGAPDVGKLDRRGISAKKRKAKEWQENQVHPSEPLMEVDNHLEANKISFEGSSESELKKGKKARVLKSEETDSHKVMDGARTDKRDRDSQILNSISRDFVTDEVGEAKGYVDKDLQQAHYRVGSMMSQQILDNVDPVKRDLGYGMPSLAATSSSSKVSGSHKSKANFQESKGSPVESVSSSPMRFSEGTSANKVLLGKYDVTNGTMGSLKKYSDGEGEGRGGYSGSARKEKSHSVVHHKTAESSMLDYHEVNPTSGVKAKALIEPLCNEFGNPHVVNGGSDTLNQRVELLDKEYGHDGERVDKYNGSNGSLSRKSGKGSSSRSKEKHKGSKSDVDRGKIKVSDSFINQEDLHPSTHFKNEAETEQQDFSHYHEDSKGAKYSSQEKYGVKGSTDEKSCLGKKEYFGKWSDEGRRDKQSKLGGNDVTDSKLNPACSKDGKCNAHQNSIKDRVGERSSHRSLSERPDQLNPAIGRGKSHSFPHSGDKQETQTRCPRPISSSHKGHGSELLPVDASSGGGGGDDLKVAKHSRRPDNQAGGPHNSLRHSTPGRVGVGDLDGPSPFRKDSSSQTANNFLKEAKDLKHYADRLKNSGSDLDSTGLYFEAVLKFLHGASLLEPCSVESSRHGESQSVHIYSTTVGLCEFVAQQYERCKQMAAAALAYKCLEVAWMRVVYFRHTSISKDRNELQSALHMVPPGESPSSSASDVDNLNNQGAVDKVALAKGVGSPHVAGNHVIAARNRPNFVRVLNFIQDVNSAMEAYRKSKNAFAVASASLEESQYEGISAVKRVLDYSFDDVQGLLRLVRVAKEAIRC